MDMEDIVRLSVREIAEAWNRAAMKVISAKVGRPLSREDILTGTHDVCGKPWVKHTFVCFEVSDTVMHDRLTDSVTVSAPDIPMDFVCPGHPWAHDTS